jgi:8-oxo-dGTP pyrophosphatase MutT (NUDIX family)
METVVRWGSYLAQPPAPECAGVLVVARSTQRILLLKRTDRDVWESPGGHLEPGETHQEGALRELHEETGYVGTLSVSATALQTGPAYQCFLGMVSKEFRPELTEHLAWVWASKRQLPRGTHPGVREAIRCLR